MHWSLFPRQQRQAGAAACLRGTVANPQRPGPGVPWPVTALALSVSRASPLSFLRVPSKTMGGIHSYATVRFTFGGGGFSSLCPVTALDKENWPSMIGGPLASIDVSLLDIDSLVSLYAPM